jgi:phosphatidylglycerophosphate synthase
MTGLVVLALLGLPLAALVVTAVVTAERPPHPVPDQDGYLDRWQELHGGYDPRRSRPVRSWLALAHRVARPLARRGVQPDVVTLSSVWFAVAALVLAARGGHWPVLAGALLAAGGLLDTLDGAVAVLERRTTAWGYVLDSLVDRVNDVLYLAAVVLLGAPLELAVGCGVALFLLEYVRARGGNAGGGDVGRITVGERPTRVSVLSASVLTAGVLVGSAPVVATAGLAVTTALTAAGLGQLVVTVRRQLREPAVQGAGGGAAPAAGT